ncbi:UNVERIFIED_CONTAM: hypothetical protein Sangu_2833100 [Sesamum angustifolium]|uniref:Uncharacterized protein n=1 Tax=Sesamum angustifolium TaxID=2727405 RepID=A0AAW2IRQ3_9LAMI
MMGSKKRIRPLSECNKGIAYALRDTFMLLKAVATVVDGAGMVPYIDAMRHV